MQVDGTVIIERTDENERFYGERIKVADILAGKARHPPPEIKTLMATIRAAQGDTVEESALPSAEPTPGDMELEKPREVNGFGLPSEDDPDPFGVQELQAHGMEIREAGTKARPSLEAFEYRPNPSSPIFTTYRRSLDSNHSRRDSKRDSVRSVASTDRGTQTEPASSPITYMESPRNHSPLEKTTENLAEDSGAEEGLGISHISQPEPPTIMEQAAPQPVISRARLVTIPKRIPPALPPRSPYRQSAPAASLESSPQLPQDSFHDKSTDPLSPQPSHLAGVPSDDHDPKADSIDHTLSTIHLSPTPPSHSLKERKASEDTASMSGSDYSRETPGIEERPQTPLTLEDQEATPVKPTATSNGFHDISMEDHEATPVKPTAAILTGDGFHDEYVTGEGKEGKEGTGMKREESQVSEKGLGEDEFHSVPGTPVEARVRGNLPGGFP